MSAVTSTHPGGAPASPARSARLRLPWTLWRALFVDMWKQMLLTAAVLVVVIAFGATVKPLADGKIGPIDALRFMLLAIPPMLQYALPFAACFGATMAYYRLATDNEVTAAQAAGISHARLLMPALATGVILAGTLLWLSNDVIPRYLRQMEELITQNATQLFITAIRNGESVRQDDLVIYADHIEDRTAEPGVQRLWMGGVMVVQLDRRGEIQAEVSASEVWAWFRREERRVSALAEDDARDWVTRVVLKPVDGVVRVRDSGGGRESAPLLELVIPNAFGDDPKHLSFRDMLALRQHPERMNWIERKRLDLASALAERASLDSIRLALDRAGRAPLADNAGREFVLVAGRLGFRRDTAWAPVEGHGGGAVVVERTTADGVSQRLEAQRAWLSARPASEPDRVDPVLTLRLEDVRVRDAVGPGSVGLDEAGVGRLAEWTMGELRPRGGVEHALAQTGAWRLVELGDVHMQNRPNDAAMLHPLNDLRRHLERLMREVTSKLHERLAVSVACLVMVIIGGVMAMRLRDRLPLTIYLWAFFPALASVITISAGQTLTHQRGHVGLLVLWGGVAVFAAFAFREYTRLARN